MSRLLDKVILPSESELLDYVTSYFDPLAMQDDEFIASSYGVFGLSDDEFNVVSEMTSNHFDPNAFGPLSYLFTYTSSHRTALFAPGSNDIHYGQNSVIRSCVNHYRRLLDERAMAGIMIASHDVTSPIFKPHIADGYFAMCVPITRTSRQIDLGIATQTERICGITVRVVDIEAEEDWQPVTVGGITIGYLDENCLRLRFNPYFNASSDKFSMSQENLRTALIGSILDAVLALSGDEYSRNASDRAVAKQLKKQHDVFSTYVRILKQNATSNEIAALTTRIQRSETEVQRLQNNLREAQTRLEADTEALAAERKNVAVAAQVKIQELSHVKHIREQISALPFVDEVETVAGGTYFRTILNYRVVLKDIVCECSDGTRRKFSNQTLTVSPFESGGNSISILTQHPIARNGLSLGQASVPFAQASGSKNYAAAISIIVGAMSRPIENDDVSAPRTDEPAGWAERVA